LPVEGGEKHEDIPSNIPSSEEICRNFDRRVWACLLSLFLVGIKVLHAYLKAKQKAPNGNCLLHKLQKDSKTRYHLRDGRYNKNSTLALTSTQSGALITLEVMYVENN
jgi:hypothetical protein